MGVRTELRKEAYRYILFLLGNLPSSTSSSESPHFFPLEELRLIKEGIADPSPALVTLLKELLQGTISDMVIDSNLVTPFQNNKPE
jgi:hypothetical protein